MKILNAVVLFLVLVISAITGPACDTATNILPNINIFTDSDDVQLGQQVVDQMAADTVTYPLLKGTNADAIKSYISTTIVGEVLKSSEIQKSSIYNYQTKLQIIRKDSVMNAFALPGGPIYIYTGLLKYLDNEAALAGVLGHEIAHAERRHASTRMSQQMGISALISVVLGKNPSQLAQIAAQLFTGFALLQNSRADENEADLYSFKYLRSSKYYPGSVKFFFEKMRDDGLISSNSSSIATFLSTHPDPVARIDSTNSRLSGAGISVITYKSPGSYNLYSNEYITNIKAKLP